MGQERRHLLAQSRPVPTVQGPDPTSRPVVSDVPLLVDEDLSLLITDLRVFENPQRADPMSGDEDGTVWTFKCLIVQMSGTSDPSGFARSFLSFGDPVTMDGVELLVRPGMNEKVLDPWPERPNGKLDLSSATAGMQRAS